MKFTEIPRRLQPLLAPPDPVIIHHLIKSVALPEFVYLFVYMFVCLFIVRTPLREREQRATIWKLKLSANCVCIIVMHLNSTLHIYYNYVG